MAILAGRPCGAYTSGARELVKIRNGQGFFNVKLTGISVGVGAAIVVDAIGKIGIFLHFTQHHTGTNGVRSARGDKKRVARIHGMRFKKLLNGARFDGANKLFPSDTWFQADQHLRLWPRVTGVPHFGLAAPTRGALMSRGKCAVWMHLDGKLVGRKKKLHKKGKFRSVDEGRSAPANGHFAPRPAEKLPLVGAAGDAAVDGSHPHLADRFSEISFVRK